MVNYLAISVARPFRSQLSMRRFASAGDGDFRTVNIVFGDFPSKVRELWTKKQELAKQWLAVHVMYEYMRSESLQFSGELSKSLGKGRTYWANLVKMMGEQELGAIRLLQLRRAAVKLGFHSWESIIEAISAGGLGGSTGELFLQIEMRPHDLERELDGAVETVRQSVAEAITTEVHAGRELDVEVNLTGVIGEHNQMHAIYFAVLKKVGILDAHLRRELGTKPILDLPLNQLGAKGTDKMRKARYNCVLSAVGLNLEILEAAIGPAKTRGRVTITLLEPVPLETVKISLEQCKPAKKQVKERTPLEDEPTVKKKSTAKKKVTGKKKTAKKSAMKKPARKKVKGG